VAFVIVHSSSLYRKAKNNRSRAQTDQVYQKPDLHSARGCCNIVSVNILETLAHHTFVCFLGNNGGLEYGNSLSESIGMLTNLHEKKYIMLGKCSRRDHAASSLTLQLCMQST
jgi:hypothetical protein